MSLVREAYDIIHLALWSALAAFVIIFFVFVWPDLPAIQREIAARQHLAEEQEVNDLCVKWGLKLQTPAHTSCAIDLRQYRTRIEERTASSIRGIF